MDLIRQVAQVIHGAEERGVLGNHRGNAVVQPGEDRSPVTHSVARRCLQDFDIEIGEVGSDNAPRERIHRTVQDNPPSSRNSEAHESSLGQGCAAVIERGVGRIHAGEPTDGGLVLVKGLEGPLGTFGLVGGIGGGEFRPGRKAVDHGRNDMVVPASADERDDVMTVPGRQFPNPAQHLELGHARRKVERPGAQFRGYAVEQFRDLGDSDDTEHLADLFRGMGAIAGTAHGSTRT